MKLKFLFCFIFFGSTLSAQITRFEQSNGTESAPYFEGIKWWENFAKKHSDVSLEKNRSTDIGQPLHLITMTNFPKTITKEAISNKTIILINNAIHPGEPCGVDASVKLAKQFLEDNVLPEKLTVAIIPMYNIGGATNRSCCSRANQFGPEEYGFRGNARTLDLNRDFIKCGSKNARAFVKLFREWDPNVFVDTHTSNGADYQHVMTLITTQTDKLNPALGQFVVDEMRPKLFEGMKGKNYPMVPYMHGIGKTPKEGIMDYLKV